MRDVLFGAVVLVGVLTVLVGLVVGWFIWGWWKEARRRSTALEADTPRWRNVKPPGEDTPPGKGAPHRDQWDHLLDDES